MNILEQIKDCEKDAASVRAKAVADAREIVRTGERDAKDAAQTLISKAKDNAEHALESASTLADKKADELIAESAQRDRKLVGDAAAFVDGAVRFITEGVQKL
ncbi:MAG: hypothetical protein RSB78_01120 [Oscillospiraceae bacterium]